jgi:hypothetical protein
VLADFVGRWPRWARDWVWPMALAEATEAVAVIEDVQHAQVLVDELEGYRGEIVAVGAAVLCLGAYDRFRGMLLSLLGRHDEAVTAFEEAQSVEAPMRAAALSAHTSYWLALALLRRGGPGDRDRALGELASGMVTADRQGLLAIGTAPAPAGVRAGLS